MSSDQEIVLTQEQQAAVNEIDAWIKNPLAKTISLQGGAGCIDGDTWIKYQIKYPDGEEINTKGGCISKLFRRFNGIAQTKGKGRRDFLATTREHDGIIFTAPSVSDSGRVFSNIIEDVIDSGTKECIAISTSYGLRLVCTYDHPIFCGDTYKAAGGLKVGDVVYVDNRIPWRNPPKSRIHRKELLVKFHPVCPNKLIEGKYLYKRIKEYKAIYEAHMNGLTLDEYVARLNSGHLDGLIFLDRGLDIHHRDENPLNNNINNLEAISHADHAKEHLIENMGYRNYKAGPDEIVLVEYVGLRHVFDIKMQSPVHNFVADGIVVHNSGKTTCLNHIKKLLPGATSWSGMTGKAALRVSQLANVTAKTLHATIYMPPRNSGKYLHFSAMKKPDCQYLIVDETSMAGPKIWTDLQEWIAKGVKILFVGDGYQLPPIMTPKEEQEHGEDFIIFREVKGPMLTKVMRSGDGIIDIVSAIRETKRIPNKGNDSVYIGQAKYPGLCAIKDYLEDPEDHVLITWTNRLRMQGNQEIRRKLGHKQLLPGPDEPILICKNGQERLNGEMVRATHFTEGPKLADVHTMWMHVDDGTKVLVSVNGKDCPMDGFMPNVKDWREYHQQRNKQKMEEPLPITYGFTLTAHKAQGSEFRRVSVYLSGSDVNNDHFNKMTKLPNGEEIPFSIRHLYTSLSRAKSRASLYIGL